MGVGVADLSSPLFQGSGSHSELQIKTPSFKVASPHGFFPSWLSSVPASKRGAQKVVLT